MYCSPFFILSYAALACAINCCRYLQILSELFYAKISYYISLALRSSCLPMHTHLTLPYFGLFSYNCSLQGDKYFPIRSEPSGTLDIILAFPFTVCSQPTNRFHSRRVFVITDIPRSLLLPPLGRHMNYPYTLILNMKIILKNYF